MAIWDTGATGTVITQAVVDACGLKPTGMIKTYDASGEKDSETYLVSVTLPNTVRFHSVKAINGVLNDADVLIGMDIIGQGDFAVTNFKGQTKFSFRMPSKAHIDFVAEHKRESAAPQFSHGGKKRDKNKGKR